MGVIRSIQTAWHTIVTNAEAPSTSGFLPLTDFVPSGPILRVRAAMETRNRIGTIELRPAFNEANTALASTNTPKPIGSGWTSTTGQQPPSSFDDVAAAAAAYQLFRFGVVARNASGTFGQMDVRLRFDIDVDPSVRAAEFPWTTIFAASTTPVFIAITGWSSGASIAKARAVWEQSASTTALDVALAAQTADNVESPDAATAISGYSSTAGMNFPSDWSTVNASNKALVRLGWMVKRPSGSGVALARIAAQLETAS